MLNVVESYPEEEEVEEEEGGWRMKDVYTVTPQTDSPPE